MGAIFSNVLHFAVYTTNNGSCSPLGGGSIRPWGCYYYPGREGTGQSRDVPPTGHWRANERLPSLQPQELSDEEEHALEGFIHYLMYSFDSDEHYHLLSDRAYQS